MSPLKKHTHVEENCKDPFLPILPRPTNPILLISGDEDMYRVCRLQERETDACRRAVAVVPVSL